MGSEDCFDSYRQKHTKQSSELIETKTHKRILRTHIDKSIQNNPQNPYRKKHTKQPSELIETTTHKTILRTHIDKNPQSNPQNP
jgi:hypothetical protein